MKELTSEQEDAIIDLISQHDVSGTLIHIGLVLKQLGQMEEDNEADGPELAKAYREASREVLEASKEVSDIW